MESEIASIRANLKPTVTKVPKLDQTSDFTQEESLKLYETYFDVGAQKWYPLFADLTFPTLFIPLSRDQALSLLIQCQNYKNNPNNYQLAPKESGLDSLKDSIEEALAKAQWKKAFVKLSTRSPKDSIHILQRGFSTLKDKLPTEEQRQKFLEQNLNDRLSLISQCIQDNFYIENGSQAMDVLISSERVLEDIVFAFSNEPKIPYEKCCLHIVLRLWTDPIPITQEFRGFVWNRSLNAIGQYYHSIFFPDLDSQKEEIKQILSKFFEEKIKPKLNDDSLKCCIVDLALLNKDSVMLIEINPFDGKVLASLKGSTGLFDLDNPNDEKLVKEGPLELRIRNKAMTDSELKMRLNVTWKAEMKGFI